MGNKGHKRRKKFDTVKIIIGIILYAMFSIALPFVFKFIFENPLISYLSNNEWAGFLGSYVGGILGGLGTLIAMWYTVRTSLEIQRENKSDTDRQIQEEAKRRDEEYTRDKKDRELMRLSDQASANKRDREEFANSVASHLGVYISQISKYYFANLKAESLQNSVKGAKRKVDEIKNKIIHFDKYVNKNKAVSTDADQTHQISKWALEEERIEAERKYHEVLQEQKHNSEWGNRLKANEEYFIMNALLSDIDEAQIFLTKLSELHHDSGFCRYEERYGKWLEDKIEVLLEEYANFRKTYVNKSK